MTTKSRGFIKKIDRMELRMISTYVVMHTCLKDQQSSAFEALLSLKKEARPDQRECPPRPSLAARCRDRSLHRWMLLALPLTVRRCQRMFSRWLRAEVHPVLRSLLAAVSSDARQVSVGVPKECWRCKEIGGRADV